MHPRFRHPVRLVGAAVVLLLIASASGCAALFSSDGDDVARRGAVDVAEQIGAHSDNTAEVTVEEIVTWWVLEAPGVAAGGAEVDALAWSGAIGSPGGASVDVRIHVEVGAYSSPTIGGRSHSAGAATVCYRLVWERYEQARRSEIPCPDAAPPPPPPPVLPERPDLTAQDSARVAEILGSVSEVDAIDAALREAFPADDHRIEVTSWNGETVVAVGIPAERECILVVRSETGALSSPSYRRISLEPGEAGCTTALYTNPPF